MRLLIALLLCFAHFQVDAATLHAILVCDTLAENIERASHADLFNMREEANRIAMYTDLNLHEMPFCGEELMPEDILKQIGDLNVKDDDVILFYFTGHGYRTASKEGSPWPNLFLTAAQKGLDYGTVGERLRAKKPRLMISLADCCNNTIPDAWAPPLVTKDGVGKDKLKQIKKGYKKLFVDQSGSIQITSSQVGEYSWCMMKGAVFTLALLEAIQKETLLGSKVSWQKILDQSAEEVARYQHPYWEIKK